MARGKKKKGNEKKVQEKEYKLITLEEMQALENKYTHRLLNLKVCANIIDEITLEAAEIQQDQSSAEEWRKYLLCDGLPKPSQPPDIRLFFAKMRFFEEATIEKAIDWLLSVDERSILCQDIFNKDRTRRALVTELRPDIGAEYEKNVHLLLRVLHDIECLLDVQNKDLTLPTRIIYDIIEQKRAIHQDILQFFDRFTYRVLSSEDSYMNSVNPITYEYFYSCDHFDIQIWALKNVPVLFEFMETPALLAKLHCLKVRLQLPVSILEENISIRAVHYKFDHFSEHAKSFEQQIDAPTDNPAAGIADLYESLINEWELQQAIRTEVLNKMIERRLDYEEKLRLYNEEQERIKKAKDAPPKKYKRLKPPKEYPKVSDDAFPDILDDFLQREKEQYTSFITTVYHPDVLDLASDEINMKKYQILGGIYQFYFVTKPTHYKFRSFNMTWHMTNGKLEIDENVKVHGTAFHNMSQTSLGRSQTSLHRPRPSLRRNSMGAMPVESDVIDSSPYFVVTIELSPHLCLWGDPQPCHFEADIIGFINNSISTKASAKVPTPPPPPAMDAAVPDAFGSPHQSMEFAPTRERPSSMGLWHTAGVITRPSILNVFRPSLITLQSTTTRQLTPSGGKRHSTTVDLDDFRLDRPLTMFQIRDIQRHCLPLIISSFKFPKELKEDDEEIARNKPKAKGGFMRKRTSDEQPLKESDPGFTREHQNNPERLFPHFPQLEKMLLTYRLTEYGAEVREEEPETFGALIDTLHNIKADYRDVYLNTLKVPKFKPKIDLYKLRKLLGKDKDKQSEQQTPNEEVTSQRGSQMSLHSRKSLILHIGDANKSSRRIKRRSLDSKSGGLSRQVSQRFDPNRSEVTFGDSDHYLGEDAATETRETFKFSHWTKQHIMKSVFDRANSRLTIWTDRLGTIGLAFKRYAHFPFKYWSLEPNIERSGAIFQSRSPILGGTLCSTEPEVIFTLDTKYVTCVIFVNAKGYRGYATEQTKKFLRNRAMYLVIEEPLQDLKAIKKIFRENNINIFSEHDASFYIEDGYFSEKHLAAELHTYSCMVLNSLYIKFKYSQWNRLAQRRDILLHFVQYREPDENMVLARITPEDGTFVEVKELCSDNLDQIKLDYTLTWRNIDHYSDLYHMIPSMYLSATDARVKDAKLILNLRALLSEIRPLSYS